MIDKIDYLFEDAKKTLEDAYLKGYSDGIDQAKKKYGDFKGIAHMKRATKEEIEQWGIELVGWCDCGKAIEGRWVGMANFCPWCGKIMDWEKPKNIT